MPSMTFGSHKQYTLARVVDTESSKIREVRTRHERGALRQFLADCEPGSPLRPWVIGTESWMNPMRPAVSQSWCMLTRLN
jgi:hypothetical protein